MSNSSFNSSKCKFRISKEYSCHSDKVEFNMYKPYFEEAFPEFEVVDLHINVVMKCHKGKVIVSISNCNYFYNDQFCFKSDIVLMVKSRMVLKMCLYRLSWL